MPENLTIYLSKMNNNYNGWYVLYVKSRHEKKVHDLLREASLESFLPLIASERKWSDRKKNILTPLFPSYVFVNVNSSLEFYKALEFNGVYTYIRFGREYAKMTDHEIRKIRTILDLEGVTNVKSDTQLKVGDSAKIAYGSLYGLECEILRVNSQSEVFVRFCIESLQQDITATIPTHLLTSNAIIQ